MFELSPSPALASSFAPVLAAPVTLSGEFAATLADLATPAVQAAANPPVALPLSAEPSVFDAAVAPLPPQRQESADIGNILPPIAAPSGDNAQPALGWLETDPEGSLATSPTRSTAQASDSAPTLAVLQAPVLAVQVALRGRTEAGRAATVPPQRPPQSPPEPVTQDGAEAAPEAELQSGQSRPQRSTDTSNARKREATQDQISVDGTIMPAPIPGPVSAAPPPVEQSTPAALTAAQPASLDLTGVARRAPVASSVQHDVALPQEIQGMAPRSEPGLAAPKPAGRAAFVGPAPAADPARLALPQTAERVAAQATPTTAAVGQPSSSERPAVARPLLLVAAPAAPLFIVQRKGDAPPISLPPPPQISGEPATPPAPLADPLSAIGSAVKPRAETQVSAPVAAASSTLSPVEGPLAAGRAPEPNPPRPVLAGVGRIIGEIDGSPARPQPAIFALPAAPQLAFSEPLQGFIGVPQPAGQAFATQIAAAAVRASRAPREDKLQPSSAAGAISGSPPAVAAPDPVIDPTPIDTGQRDWTRSLIDRIDAVQDVANARDTRIRLIPDALGKIDVALHRQGDTLHVQFTADVPATRALLAEAQPRLAELADARGLRIGQSSVDGGTGYQGQDSRRPPLAPTPIANRRTAPGQGDQGDIDHRIA